jgi:hypothetical protein
VPTDRSHVLLHETIHAIVQYYPCKECDMYTANQLAGGHGGAFQWLAVAIERAFPRLLGIPIQTDSFMSIPANWQFQRPLPSHHDLITFILCDLRNSSVHQGDVVEWTKKTKAMHGFLPTVMMGQCHVEEPQYRRWGLHCCTRAEMGP